MALEITKSIFFLFLFYFIVRLWGHQTQMVVYTVFSHFGCDSLSAYTHYKKLTFPLEKLGWTNVSKPPMHYQLKLYEWLWEKKITCCKNTVNSTAECAEEEARFATSWSLQLYWVIRQTQTATLTFSDLYVESSTVGLRGGGASEGKRPRLSRAAWSVLKT